MLGRVERFAKGDIGGLKQDMFARFFGTRGMVSEA